MSPLDEGAEPTDAGALDDVPNARAEPDAPAARQLSRSGRGRSVPWEPVASPAASRARAAATQTVAQERRRREAAAQRRRRRAVAVLSAAGILAGGGGWVAVNGATSKPATTPTGAGPGAVAPDEAARWAGQAEVVLTSVTQQLDVVAQAQEAWNKRPESRRASAPPAPVAQMLERKALLEQQRATLESQLAAWRSLDKVNGELTSADQQLAAVDKALESLPRGEQLTTEQAASVKQLAEQRDVRVRQRDAKKQELDSLKSGVRNAVGTPLQDTADKTKALTESVLGLVDGRTPATPSRPDHEPTPGVANRDNPNRERQDTNNSAPPTPGKARAGASPNPGKAVEGAVGGAVEDVVGAAGSLLPGGKRSNDGGNGGDKGRTGGNGSDADSQSSRAADQRSGQDQSKAAKADKGASVERQNKDSRGTVPRGGRLGRMTTDVLEGAGELLPGRGERSRSERATRAQAAVEAVVEAAAAEARSGGRQSTQEQASQEQSAQEQSAQGQNSVEQAAPPAPRSRTRAYDRQGHVPSPRSADKTMPTKATYPQTAEDRERQAAIEMARRVMPRLMPAATSMQPAADPAQRQSSRRVTVDQLVDYAWQRAMKDAQSRQADSASESVPADEAAATPSPRRRQAAAAHVPAEYQEMVSAWSSGR